MSVSSIRTRASSVVVSTLIGVALAAALATPASADAAPVDSAPPVTTTPISTTPISTTPISTTPISTTPSDPTPQALTDFTDVTTLTDSPVESTPMPATAEGDGLSVTADSALSVIGKRQTFTRGGALAWASDTFEWYWSGSKMTSSSAWQADGYVFPNTVTLKGVKRTLKSSSQHLWRGTASIGAGVVTPWGTVDVYSTTVTDYFTLTPNKLTHSTN